MLERTGTDVAEERNSRKDALDDAAAQELVDQVEQVLVAKGKKLRELAAADTSLDDLKGPTGNYRAPIVRIGDRLLVGFNAEKLEQLVTG
ncbi:MAG: hypothetical protein AAGC60_26625 [Acidobacteriota bacterium]